jgi:polysaccharide export outer membrane protein
MKKDANVKTAWVDWHNKKQAARQLVKRGLTFWLLVLVAGCQTQVPQFGEFGERTKQTIVPPEVITLREGDVLKISFPGSSSLDTTQQIRRDGKITLPLVGEVQAAGMTTEALRENLVKLYAPQLSTKEVTVTVASSTFPVYVNGSVLRPGKIMSDRPMTAFEAIMEAGGFDYAKANLKGVMVIRQEGSHSQKYILNLKLVMEGKGGEPFYLKPGDTVIVPEKFTWF